MKKANLCLIGLVALLYFFTPSCRKGDMGGQGPKGTDGSPILSGEGAPSASAGKAGDFYLDLTSMLFYGPKTATGWGMGVSIKGAEGTQDNANVVVDTFTVASAQWSYASNYYMALGPNNATGIPSKFFRHQNTLLTPDFISTGLILVYFAPTSGPYPLGWNPLPYSDTEPASQNYTFNYAYQLDLYANIQLDFFFTKISNTAPALSTFAMPNLKFKLVLVPGVIATKLKNIVQSRRQAILN